MDISKESDPKSHAYFHSTKSRKKPFSLWSSAFVWVPTWRIATVVKAEVTRAKTKNRLLTQYLRVKNRVEIRKNYLSVKKLKIDKRFGLSPFSVLQCEMPMVKRGLRHTKTNSSPHTMIFRQKVQSRGSRGTFQGKEPKKIQRMCCFRIGNSKVKNIKPTPQNRNVVLLRFFFQIFKWESPSFFYGGLPPPPLLERMTSTCALVSLQALRVFGFLMII